MLHEDECLLSRFPRSLQVLSLQTKAALIIEINGFVYLFTKTSWLKLHSKRVVKPLRFPIAPLVIEASKVRHQLPPCLSCRVFRQQNTEFKEQLGILQLPFGDTQARAFIGKVEKELCGQRLQAQKRSESVVLTAPLKLQREGLQKMLKSAQLVIRAALQSEVRMGAYQVFEVGEAVDQLVGFEDKLPFLGS